MKILGIIKKIIIVILGIVFFSFTIIMTILLLSRNDYGITQFNNTSLLFISETYNNYNKGDLVVVEAKKIRNIKLRDELFVYQFDNSGIVSIDSGIVSETYPNENIIFFEDGGAYAMELVIGKPSKVYSKIGGYLSIILSKWGFLFIVLIPCFLVFIYEIYALIFEIKYVIKE